MVLVSVGIAVIGQEGEGNDDYQYALIEAVKQKNLGNIQEAVKLYRLVVENKPDCAVAHYELGTIYLMAGDREAAVESMARSFALDPGNQWYTAGYLTALGAVEDFRSMERILAEKLKEEPDEVEWQFQMANVQYAAGKYKKAVRILERIEKERGFSEKVTLLKASIFESQEKFDLAKEEIGRVMDYFPEALQLWMVAAELSMKSGDEAEAANYYHQILEADSTNIFALTNLTDFYRKKGETGKSFEYLARSFRSRSIDVKRKMAILAYYLSEEEIIQKYPTELDRMVRVFLEVHPDEPEGLLMATDFYIDTGEYGHAYQQLRKYLDLVKGTYQMYMQAVLLANAASMNDALIEVADRALEYFPDSADIRFFRAIGLYEKSDFNELVNNFEKVSFDRFSENDYALQSKMLYAEALYRLNNFTRSDSLFESLIAEDPENHVVLNNYSYYLAERGEKLEMARAWSKKTIIENPDNATFIDTYAWILYRLEDYVEAEKYILQALEKGGANDPEVNEHAGDIQVALGNYRIAEAYYRKAMILGGDRERIQRKVDEVIRISNE